MHRKRCAGNVVVFEDDRAGLTGRFHAGADRCVEDLIPRHRAPCAVEEAKETETCGRCPITDDGVGRHGSETVAAASTPVPQLLTVLEPTWTVGAFSIAVPAIRHSILRTAGRMLVADDRVGSADVIVVSGESKEPDHWKLPVSFTAGWLLELQSSPVIRIRRNASSPIAVHLMKIRLLDLSEN